VARTFSWDEIAFNLILEEHMKLSQEDIIDRMEELKEGESLKFNIPEIFGGGIAIIGFNPQKGGKKYLLQLGNGGNASPYWDTNKAKDLAKWVADRLGDLV
jgi:hypothetical protein